MIEYNTILCPGNRDAGRDPLWQPVLTRAYPRAAPGQLDSLVSDPTTGDLQLTGNGRGTLRLWVPQRNGGRPHVAGTGVGRATLQPVRGGWQVSAEVFGAYQVQVTLTKAVVVG